MAIRLSILAFILCNTDGRTTCTKRRRVSDLLDDGLLSSDSTPAASFLQQQVSRLLSTKNVAVKFDPEHPAIQTLQGTDFSKNKETQKANGADGILSISRHSVEQVDVEAMHPAPQTQQDKAFSKTEEHQTAKGADRTLTFSPHSVEQVDVEAMHPAPQTQQDKASSKTEETQKANGADGILSISRHSVEQVDVNAVQPAVQTTQDTYLSKNEETQKAKGGEQTLSISQHSVEQMDVNAVQFAVHNTHDADLSKDEETQKANATERTLSINQHSVEHVYVDPALPVPVLQGTNWWNPVPSRGGSAAVMSNLAEARMLAFMTFGTILLCIVALREVIRAYRRPATGMFVSKSRTFMKVTSILIQLIVSVEACVLMPAAYDIIQGAGLKAIKSSLILGIHAVGLILGGFIAKVLYEYDFHVTRRILVVCMAVAALLDLTFAYVVLRSVGGFWLLVFLRGLTGTVVGITALANWSVLAVLRSQEQIAVGVGHNIAACAGIWLVPLLWMNITPTYLDADPAFGCTAIAMSSMATCWCALALWWSFTPEDLNTLEYVECTVNILNFTRQLRRTIQQRCVLYTLDCVVATSGLHAASSVILHKDCGWSTGWISMAGLFTGVCSLTLSVPVARTTNHTPVLVLLGVGSLVAASLTFKFRNGMAVSLIIANVLMCTSMYNISGVMDGFANMLVVPGTRLTIENMHLAKRCCSSVGAFVGPIWSYTIMSLCGQNWYATMQIVSVLVSLVSVFKVWHCLKVGWLVHTNREPSHNKRVSR
mmetsp:Transcript_55134/g.147155  ORF Transcript_55134/g.147155 Transcript_55134/m.147155 type:complete len:769 (-) Transcript_55134:39-2345(-)